MEIRSLKIVFFGSPEFAVPCLETVSKEHQVVAVVTQPDRPRGRGRSIAQSPVKKRAQELGLDVLDPERLRCRSVREGLMGFGADMFVVVAYGQILSPRLLTVPPMGCINVHGSLLPRHRGAAPIQWAVLKGDKCAGITIIQMDAGVDTGPILLQESVELDNEETSGTLYDRLAPVGARLLLKALAGVQQGVLEPVPQDNANATLAPMLSKGDGRVDFLQSAKEVDCWIRGMDPWPGAFADLQGQTLRLFRSRVTNGKGRPGEILEGDERGLLVACKEKAVWVQELQLPGRRRMPAISLLAGNPIKVGTILG
ncbi:MAG: methionyl-tRNA formyltransferase [Pseudomonadota bacterium]